MRKLFLSLLLFCAQWAIAQTDSVPPVFPFHVENGKVKSVTVRVADFIEYNP